MQPLVKGLLAVAIFAAGIGTVMLLVKESPATMLSADGDGDRMDRIEREQEKRYAELNAKLDRLAAHLERGASPSAPRRSPPAPVLDLEAAAAKSRDVRAELEQSVLSEPVSPQWALETSRSIEAALASADIREIGAEPPLGQTIECRSTMCRIEMVFSNPDHAIDAGTVLNMGIADRLPYTRAVRDTLPDGSTQMIVYAYRDRPKS
ncbi:hypothetical protein [Arenimonas terrae]|jgi:hypothetical protein|uniref:Uncharacterized protein n=1 Tax=Arenimonas terrae TaxID=2546226 RepID=A0A5C4RSX0_9GAMM|nr:hypothetical protein [Arenimonas terrae]TNJ33961.1 hypothetical protein E1B00_11580 [Arenimonas terrae]